MCSLSEHMLPLIKFVCLSVGVGFVVLLALLFWVCVGVRGKGSLALDGYGCVGATAGVGGAQPLEEVAVTVLAGVGFVGLSAIGVVFLRLPFFSPGLYPWLFLLFLFFFCLFLLLSEEALEVVSLSEEDGEEED